MRKKISNTVALVWANLINYLIKPFMREFNKGNNTCDNVDVRRIIELDILRGIAIILVLGRHILDIPETLSPLVRQFFLTWREVGWIGVDLFFVLSGFLVSGLLFREYRETGKLRIGSFLLRRGWKIYPPFYAFLIVSLFTSCIFSFPVEYSQTPYLGEVLFIQNYMGGVWNHTWSLAVEEHFYITLAIILLALAHVRPNAKDPFIFLPKLLLTIAVCTLLIRVWVAQAQPVGAVGATFFYTHSRVDSLFFGVLISYYYAFRSNIFLSTTRRWLWLCPVFVCLSFLMPIFLPLAQNRFTYSFGLSFLYLGFGSLLLFCLHPASKAKIGFISKFPGLAYVGRNSYSIYLWHMFFYYLAARIWTPMDTSPKYFFLRTIVYFASSLIAGILAAKAIEVPTLYLRDRYFPTRKRKLEPTAVINSIAPDQFPIAPAADQGS